MTRPQGAGCDMGAVELVPFTIAATEGSQFSGSVATQQPCGVFNEPAPTIKWGDGLTAPGTVTEPGISGSHTYAEEGTYNGSVTYHNDCGAGVHTVAFQAKVADAALSATGEAVSATAGVQFSGRVASFSDADPGGVALDYTASINWGDDSPSTSGTISSVAGKGFAVTGSHTYTSGGVYQTSVTITDAGGAKTIATGSAKVAFTIQATEGSQFSGEVVGPIQSCFLESATINWGDRTPSSSGTIDTSHSLVSGNHTYAEEGTFSGSVSYEGDCSSREVTFQATVADAALDATGGAVSAVAGQQFSGAAASFSDADPGGVASDYTASINWGDDSPSTSGTISSVAGKGFAVTDSHAYASGGVYQITVTITDAGGAKTIATGSATVAKPGPPAVSSVSVQSVTETTATIVFTIDPDNADTSYVIDYGPNAGYGLSTAPVDIGATGGPQHLTRTLTELEPGHTYHFDVVATNSQAAAGEHSEDQPFTTQSNGSLPTTPFVPPSGPPGGAGGVLGFVSSAPGPATLATLPPPVLGKTVNVDVVSGKVFVSLPSTGYVAPLSLAGPPLETAFASLSKGFKFIPLTEARQIPVGSTLETTGGVVAVVTATATTGKTQSGEFQAGIFTMLQNRRQKGLTELDIIDNHSASQVCATLGKGARIASKKLSSKVLGRLTGSDNGGRFETRGQYSAATVRGTVWGVRNRCDGTLTKVTRGIVSVRDFRRRKTITLFAGQSYLAKAPGY